MLYISYTGLIYKYSKWIERTQLYITYGSDIYQVHFFQVLSKVLKQGKYIILNIYHLYISVSSTTGIWWRNTKSFKLSRAQNSTLDTRDDTRIYILYIKIIYRLGILFFFFWYLQHTHTHTQAAEGAEEKQTHLWISVLFCLFVCVRELRSRVCVCARRQRQPRVFVCGVSPACDRSASVPVLTDNNNNNNNLK